MIRFVLLSLYFATTIQGLQIQNGDPDWFVEDDSARGDLRIGTKKILCKILISKLNFSWCLRHQLRIRYS